MFNRIENPKTKQKLNVQPRQFGLQGLIDVCCAQKSDSCWEETVPDPGGHGMQALIPSSRW